MGVVFRDQRGVVDAWVGAVQEVDELGLRMTAIDWIVGTFTGMDEWIPWRSIERITVQTPEHKPERGYWERWQERVLARGAAGERP